MTKHRGRKLAYIPTISKRTWFHWSRAGDSSRLRGLRANGDWAADKNWTTSRVEKRIAKCNGKHELRPAVAVNFHKNKEFWRQKLLQMNIESGLVKERNRLLARFYDEVTGVWTENAIVRNDDRMNQTIRLKKIVEDWQSKLINLHFDTTRINHWDENEMGEYLGDHETKGIAWQAYLLEACRHDKNLNYLQFAFHDTDDDDRQILFAGVEPTFTTPQNNPIIAGIQSRVRPDGLGVTRSGKLVVFEVKGPEDDLGTLSAVIQGVLGAIVFQAKRDQLINVLEKPLGLRPAVQINHQATGVSVVAMVSTSVNAHGYAPRITKLQHEIIDHLFEAVDFVERIAIVRVNKRVRSCFTRNRIANPPSFTINHYWSQHS